MTELTRSSANVPVVASPAGDNPSIHIGMNVGGTNVSLTAPTCCNLDLTINPTTTSGASHYQDEDPQERVVSRETTTPLRWLYGPVVNISITPGKPKDGTDGEGTHDDFRLNITNGPPPLHDRSGVHAVMDLRNEDNTADGNHDNKKRCREACEDSSARRPMQNPYKTAPASIKNPPGLGEGDFVINPYKTPRKEEASTGKKAKVDDRSSGKEGNLSPRNLYAGDTDSKKENQTNNATTETSKKVERKPCQATPKQGQEHRKDQKRDGLNRQGNYYVSAGEWNSNEPYHYCNADGSHFFKNRDGSSFYRASDGSARYTAPPEQN